MKVTCPYCGNQNIVPADRRGGLSFLTCDIEASPGCDKTFVINIKIEKSVTARKIEGEEKASS